MMIIETIPLFLYSNAMLSNGMITLFLLTCFILKVDCFLDVAVLGSLTK